MLPVHTRTEYIFCSLCAVSLNYCMHGTVCSSRKTVRGRQVTQHKQHYPSLQYHPKSPLLHFQRNWILWTVPRRTSFVPWPLNFSSSLTWHFAVATTSPRELWLDWRARESHAPFAKSPTWPQYWTNSTDAGCGQFKFAVPTLLEGVSGRGRWGSWVSTFKLASSSTQTHQYHDSDNYYYHYCVCEYCVKILLCTQCTLQSDSVFVKHFYTLIIVFVATHNIKFCYILSLSLIIYNSYYGVNRFTMLFFF
jgi:hypothetical protein